MHGISLIQPGDLLGFSGCSLKSSVIRVCTGGLWCCSGLSHVGIAVAWPAVHRPLVCESTSLCELPCLAAGVRVRGVQVHTIRQRVATYRGRVWHYPLSEALTQLRSENLTAFCREFLGVQYDRRGAIGARHTVLAKLFRQPEDLSKLFCSEWVAACLRIVGRLDTPNASAWSPNGLVKHLVREGICGQARRIK